MTGRAVQEDEERPNCTWQGSLKVTLLPQDHPHYFPQPFPPHMVRVQYCRIRQSMADYCRIWQSIVKHGNYFREDCLISLILFLPTLTSHFTYLGQNCVISPTQHIQKVLPINDCNSQCAQICTSEMYSSVKINVNLCFSLLVHLIFNLDDSVLGTNDYLASFPGFGIIEPLLKIVNVLRMRPRAAFHCFQYRRAGEGLLSFSRE